MKVAEIQIEENGNKLIVNQVDFPSQLEMIFEGEVGDKVFITFAEMTEHEYASLEEFNGW